MFVDQGVESTSEAEDVSPGSLGHDDYIGLFGLYFLPSAKLIDAMENTMSNINRNCILYRLIFSKGPFSIAMIILEGTSHI